MVLLLCAGSTLLGWGCLRAVLFVRCGGGSAAVLSAQQRLRNSPLQQRLFLGRHRILERTRELVVAPSYFLHLFCFIMGDDKTYHTFKASGQQFEVKWW